jgi:hypothetical protein
MPMWAASISVSTLLALSSLIGLGPRHPVQDETTGVQRPVLSGIYIESAWVPEGRCSSTRITFLSQVRALQISHAATSLTLHIAPGESVRTIPIQQRAGRNISETPPLRGRGIGRWQGDELVVETETPALPLWGRLGTAGIGVLIERFIQLSPESLIYDVLYTDHRRLTTHGTFGVSLIKCDPLSPASKAADLGK